MMQIDIAAGEKFSSPLARMLQAIAVWQERRYQTRSLRDALTDMPAHMRKDIGLEAGRVTPADRPAGRSFMHDSHAAQGPRDWNW